MGLSICSSFCLLRHFLRIGLLIFNFDMVLETHMKSCVTELDFARKKNFRPWQNSLKVGRKKGFLKILKNLVINFF